MNLLHGFQQQTTIDASPGPFQTFTQEGRGCIDVANQRPMAPDFVPQVITEGSEFPAAWGL